MGIVRWSYVTGKSINSSPAIDSDGKSYVGSYDNRIYALSSEGALLWSYETGAGINWSSPAISLDGRVYVRAESVLVRDLLHHL